MLADALLAVGEVDAVGLVAGNVAVLPLHARAHLGDGLVRRARGTADLDTRHAADARDIAFDHVALQLGHGPFPL